MARSSSTSEVGAAVLSGSACVSPGYDRSIQAGFDLSPGAVSGAARSLAPATPQPKRGLKGTPDD